MIGSVIIDLSCTKKFIDIPFDKFDIRDDALFWFVINSENIFEHETQINLRYKHAFRVIWIYPYLLSNKKRNHDNNIYLVIACYRGEYYHFTKDPIREKHIWKNVEWGKRDKNYNKLGKDPGTVWVRIIDDGKANITKHELINPDDFIDRIKKSSVKKGDNLLYIDKIQNRII